MQVYTKDVKIIFKALGHEGVNDWSIKRMQNKIEALPGRVDDEDFKEKYDSASVMIRETIDNLIEAVKNGENVEIISSSAQQTEKGGKKAKETEVANNNSKNESTSEESEANVTATATKSKAGKSDKSGKKPTASTKAAPAKTSTKSSKGGEKSVEKDKFGSRVGTFGAKVNAVLSKKPRTMKEIMEAAGIEVTCYDHLKKLQEKGFVEKTDEGYKLASKA